jgi:hypothetical protein
MKRKLLMLCSFAMSCAALWAGEPTDGGVSSVPEPGSIILLGTAAAGIGYAAWRHRNK